MFAPLLARGPALRPETRGAMGVVAAMLLFSATHAVAKKLGRDLPALQVLYLGQLVLILLIRLSRGAPVARSTTPRLQHVRAILAGAGISLRHRKGVLRARQA